MKNRNLLQCVSFLLLVVVGSFFDEATAFSPRPIPAATTSVKSQSAKHPRTTTSLFLAKKSNKKSNAANKKKKGRPSTSGFGGAATETCPCGSDEPYMKCSCGQLHKKIHLLVKKETTPEQIVRARYTAYAKREIDFIIKTTHPKNKNFVTDIQHWRKQIDLNCYDNFELTKCEILDQQIIEEDKVATVTFVANMIQRDSREKTAFMETSTFEKIGGAWLYKGGEIGDPPGRETPTTSSSSDKEDEDGNEEGENEEEPDQSSKEDAGETATAAKAS